MMISRANSSNEKSLMPTSIPDQKTSADFIVIGAGIAGASVAAELSKNASVLLLEMEDQPGYHTTGRSAAMFAPTYGPKPIRALTRASEAFFKSPPPGFCHHPLLTSCETLMIARADQTTAFETALSELQGEAQVEVLQGDALAKRHPLLRDGYAVAGFLDRTGHGIDVAALHQGYLRQLRANGGQVQTRSPVSALERENGIWRVATGSQTLSAPIVVNAAGAWADRVGAMAGAETIGLVPKRRTALTIRAPEGVNVSALPLTVDIDEMFYMKPEGAHLMISPADETPSDPCDAQPDEMDVAICIDRIETAFDVSVRRIESKWAGLRSFVADKCPVAGFSSVAPGFFWLAGQGGYGIQTAPALSRVAAALAQGNALPEDVATVGLTPPSVAPDRLGYDGTARK